MEHIRAFVNDFDPPPGTPISPPNLARANSSASLSASTRGPPVDRPPIHRRSTSLTSENAAAFAEGAFSSLRKGFRSGASHVTRAGRGSIDLLMSPSSPIHEILNSPFGTPAASAYMAGNHIYAPSPIRDREPAATSRLGLQEPTFALGDESASATPARSNTPAINADGSIINVEDIQYAILPPETPSRVQSAVDLPSLDTTTQVPLPADQPGPDLSRASALLLDRTAEHIDELTSGPSSAVEPPPFHPPVPEDVAQMSAAVHEAIRNHPPHQPTPLNGHLASRRPSLAIDIPAAPSFHFEDIDINQPGPELAHIPSTISEVSADEREGEALAHYPSTFSAFSEAPSAGTAGMDEGSDSPEYWQARRMTEDSMEPMQSESEQEPEQSSEAESSEAEGPVEDIGQETPSLQASSRIEERPASPPPPSPPAEPETAMPSPVPSQATLDIQAANELFKQHTTLSSGLNDLPALESFLRASGHQTQQLELLRRQLDQQTERTSEVRDTHRLEIASLQQELDNLRKTVTGHATEMAKANATVKEEEEKRAKSISLLKALRQKLMKAESVREEAEKSAEREKSALVAERSKWESDALGLKAEKENQLNRLRMGFEREVNSVRAQYEREAQAKKAQVELEAVTAKAAQAKDSAAKDARLKEMEARVKHLEKEHDQLFEANQRISADLEASKEANATLEARLSERDLELQESHNREEASQEQLRSSARATPSDEPSPSATRALYEAEARHASRVAGLETKIKKLEKDRGETDEEMSRNMEQRLNEVERMRREIARRDAEFEEHSKSADERQRKAEAIENKVQELEDRAKGLEGLLELSRDETTRASDRLESVREEMHDRDVRITELEGRLEEGQQRENQLRTSNKTMRDELRKVQAGILSSEKSRGPGVGYFSHYASSSSNLHSNGSTAPSTPLPQSALSPPPTESTSSLPSASLASSASSLASTAETKEEEAINFEYIRNVILQFLEHKEMRPHLVGVLGVILHFTPQETRRLTSKAGA